MNATPSPRYRWWVVFMLWFVCFFNYGDRQAIYAVFPKLKAEFGFDTVQLGLIGSAFMWLYAGGAPFAGFLGDRLRRKDLILGGCVFWSIITMTTAACARLWQFVVVRALEGLGETFYFPASMSLVSDYHGGRTRSRALSVHQSSVYAGTILGSWAGAWLAESIGWRVGFYLFGGAGLVLGLVLFRFLREPARGEAEAAPPAPPLALSETLRAIFRTPVAPLLMAAFVCANFVATIFLTWTPTFLVEKFHYTLSAAGLNGTVFIHLASGLAAPLGGILADRLSIRRRGGRVLVQAAGLLLGSAFVFGVGSAADRPTLVAAMACFGVFKGIYDSNIFASLYDVIEPRARSSAAGLMNTVGWGGGALGPLWVGWFSKHGGRGGEMENMSAAIAAGGAVYLAGSALLAFAFMAMPRREGSC